MSTAVSSNAGPLDPAGTGRRASFAELFTPKLITVFREGYGLAQFRADLAAGLTVAIVALPLSMAIAIASGVPPERGLYTSIIGGFLISALGGSRFQIGGPAGAFIVLVAATGERHGIDGLLLATLIAGCLLVLSGYLRLGTYVKFIPYPVTVGFTAGIAVIILASQLKDLFGLTLAGKEPGPLVGKLITLAQAARTFNPDAAGVAVLAIVLILALRHWRPTWPGMLIAVGVAALAVSVLGLPVETIGTRYGGIPRSLPFPALPSFDLGKAQAVLPDAVSFALLGAIESLLSAVVADGMTNRRHRSNCELVAQGCANIGSALFGGICATGTIARTATNVRAGAHGPVAGMLHALFLLAFMLVAAPLASYIPLSALAGVLAVVSWNMVERESVVALFRSSRGDAIVLVVTFALVIFRDLTEGIVVGSALGAILFIQRMASAIAIEAHLPSVHEDVADTVGGARTPYHSEGSNADTVIYRISGAFFFGTASTVAAVLDRIADQRKNFVLDCSAVPWLDSTAANALAGAMRKARRSSIRFVIAGASQQVAQMLTAHGIQPPEASFAVDVEDAVTQLGQSRPG